MSFDIFVIIFNYLIIILKIIITFLYCNRKFWILYIKFNYIKKRKLKSCGYQAIILI